MGGFLQGLGEFAGGVSQGISREAEDRARRAAAKAASEEADRKREDAKNLKAFTAHIAKANDPERRLMGNETVLDVATRDAAEWEKNFQADQKGPLAGLKELGGNIAGALGIKGARTTAQAAGVLPQPTPVAPVEPGALPERASVGMPAVAAPPLGPNEGMPGPPGSPSGGPAPPPTEVGELAVEGKRGRAWTPRDRAQYRLAMASRYNQKDEAFKAADEWKGIVLGDELKGLSMLPANEMGARMSKLSGHDIDVVQNKDGKTFDIFVDNEPYKEGVNRNGIIGLGRSFIDDTPDKGWAMAQAADKEALDYKKVEADLRGKEAEIAGINSRTELAQAQIKRLNELGPLQTQEQKIKVQQLQQQVDDEGLLANEDNALDPEKAGAFDAAIYRGQAKKDDKRFWSMSVSEDEKGKTYSYTDVMTPKIAELRKLYETSPQRKKNRIGRDENGRWIVKNPTTGQPMAQRYTSFREANDKATKVWGPYDSAPAAATGGGGKTVARSTSSYGIGVDPDKQ